MFTLQSNNIKTANDVFNALQNALQKAQAELAELESLEFSSEYKAMLQTKLTTKIEGLSEKIANARYNLIFENGGNIFKTSCKNGTLSVLMSSYVVKDGMLLMGAWIKITSATLATIEGRVRVYANSFLVSDMEKSVLAISASLFNNPKNEHGFSVLPALVARLNIERVAIEENIPAHILESLGISEAIEEQKEQQKEQQKEEQKLQQKRDKLASLEEQKQARIERAKKLPNKRKVTQ